jgi:hypothetical protein
MGEVGPTQLSTCTSSFPFGWSNRAKLMTRLTKTCVKRRTPVQLAPLFGLMESELETTKEKEKN